MGMADTDTNPAARPRRSGESQRIRGLALILIVVLVALVLCTSVASAFAAEGTLPFALTPQAGAATDKGYFILEATPGQTLNQHITLSNTSPKAITVMLAGVDGNAATFGGVSYELSADPRDEVGAWIDLASRSVTLKPGASATVTFTVSVPSTATAGDHIGGICAWTPADNVTTPVAKKGGFTANVTVETRRVVAVQVVCPGVREPKPIVTGVTPDPRPDGMYLNIGIENQGTALSTGTVEIDVTPTDFSKTASYGSIIPGVELAYPVRWATNPRQGTYNAVVHLTYDDGTSVEWKGTFTVGDKETKVLNDRLVVETVPWWRQNMLALAIGAAVLILVIVGIIAAMVRSRRRQR